MDKSKNNTLKSLKLTSKSLDNDLSLNRRSFDFSSPKSPTKHKTQQSTPNASTLPLMRNHSKESEKTRPQTVPIRSRPNQSSLSLSLPLSTTEWVLRWSIDQQSGRKAELRKPSQVDFLKNGDIVVLEARKYRVKVLDRRGSQRVCIDRRTDQHLSHPKSVCTAMDGQMLVVADNNNVVLYDANGKFLRSRPVTQNKIYNIAARGPNLVMAETGHVRSVIERTLDGTPTRKFVADYKFPGHIAVQADTHHVCVSDSENHCVFLFDHRQKSAARKIGVGKYCERKLIWPTGVAFSSYDSILVADKAQDIVVEYDLRGNYKCDVLTGDKDGLRCPVAMAMSRKGKIVITEELLDYKRDHYSLKFFSPYLGSRTSVSV